MIAGLKLVMPVGKFEPEKAFQLIQDEKVNVFATVPTMVWRIVEHPDRHDYDLSSVRSGRVRRLAVGRRAAAAGAGDVPERRRRPRQRVRPHRVVVGRDAHLRARTSSTAPTRSVDRCPSSR